ncbi:unnamed protein product [Rotaria magnacalcarata]|uniref:NAD(P)(+)--arginine ADP-ribosyltransferase n=2 Tax=Rotaria magnacalcarata TaxID=392030 RepID=A0A819EA54_9BILA|nr:unnamed protein product [Rotaria magnacalcarata]
MILVGYVNDDEQLQKLADMVDSGEDANECVQEAAASISIMEREEVEFILEYMQLFYQTEDLSNTRNDHFVYEDHFNPSLFELVAKNSSYKKLRELCLRYETKPKVNVEKVMAKHDKRVAQSSLIFQRNGLSSDESDALSLALSFYTGTESETISRGASLVARRANGVVIEEKVVNELNEAALILYYSVKALAHIPYYWGYVTRSCELKDKELELYMPGNLITWIQFSSSKKGKEVAEGTFQTRNTFFKIYSITGRPIKDFSNFPTEDEVLFLPHSTFLVFKHVTSFHGKQHTIYMRQIELGLSKWSILWVDDRIYNEKWENKEHMEHASAKALNMNVHFIPKSTTENALSFLRSPFGQRLKNKDTFRIVTDMNRENEYPVYNAGARLIKAVRKMGFNNECMVFTSGEKKAKQILESELRLEEQRFVTVSDKTGKLRNFVNFGEMPTSKQQSNFDTSSKLYISSKSNHYKNDTNSYKSTITTVEEEYGAIGGDNFNTYIEMNSHMMHNPRNTDITKLVRNCNKRNLANDRHNCVLLTTGSFNPIHPLHLQNLLNAKKFLECEHQPPWNVLAGYISPTHDSYVHGKLGDSAWIPARDRCQLCDGAIEEQGSDVSSWVSVSRGESEWSDGFVDFGPVTENLRDFLNDALVDQQKILRYPLCVVYICGLDHFNKCSYVERMAKQDNMSCAIVYRVGCDEQQISRSVKKSGCIYIPLVKERNKLTDVSSTLIRQYFQKSVSNTSNIERFIYPNVRRYMSKKYGKK